MSTQLLSTQLQKSGNLEDAIERVAILHLGSSLNPGSLERLTGGAVQQAWSFETDASGRSLSFVLRCISTDGRRVGDHIDPETEARLVMLADSHGVPVATVRHVLESQDNLGRGFISDRIEGETLGARIVREARYSPLRIQLAAECGSILAQIHKIPTADLPPLPIRTAKIQWDELDALYCGSGLRSPVFEAALQRLKSNMPPDPENLCLVHGDFRNGNLIFGPEGIRAVLDWEMAHLGDPAEDLGWITVNSWRFGAIEHEVGGFGSVEQLLDGYGHCGRGIDHSSILFWRMMGSLRWGISCREMARLQPGGEPISVERALIGRRSSETELDLLDMMAPAEAER